MIGKNGKKTTPKSGRRTKWLSLDSFMGKALCILLVLILTVGAFLAPKLMSNLYDAGTLMQITYVDMDLSPYAINYLTMDDKLQAIARVKAAGGSLSMLRAGEETSDAVSDAELAGAVSIEIDALGPGINVFFSEVWWTMLTEDNLVSRTKYTLYGRPEGAEGDTSQEMAPFQFWVLEFALMDEDAAGFADQKGNRYASGYAEAAAEYAGATDRLMVCMDAEFYKIYAVSFSGREDRISAMYGSYLTDILSMNGAGAIEFSMGAEDREERLRIWTDIMGVLMDYWADYWDTVPNDRILYPDIESELVGAYVYRNAGAGDMDGAGGPEGENGSILDAEAEGLPQQATEVVVVTNAAATDVEEIVRQELGQGDQTFLILGAQGQRVWGEEDSAAFVQKIGCRDFFEMMQF